MTIGEKIKEERVKQGLTQVQLAHLSNLKGGGASICRIERSDNIMTDTLKKVSNALGRQPNYFLNTSKAS